MNPPKTPKKSAKKTQPSPTSSQDIPSQANPQNTLPKETPPPHAKTKIGTLIFFQLLFSFSLITLFIAGILFQDVWEPPLRKTLNLPSPQSQNQEHIQQTLNTLLSPYASSQQKIEKNLNTITSTISGQNQQLHRELLLANIRLLNLSLHQKNTESSQDPSLIPSLSRLDTQNLLNLSVLDPYQKPNFLSSSLLAHAWQKQVSCPRNTPATPPPPKPKNQSRDKAPEPETSSFWTYLTQSFKNIVQITPIEPSPSTHAPAPATPSAASQTQTCVLWHTQIASLLKNHQLQKALDTLATPPHNLKIDTNPWTEHIKTLISLDTQTQEWLRLLDSPAP